MHLLSTPLQLDFICFRFPISSYFGWGIAYESTRFKPTQSNARQYGESNITFFYTSLSLPIVLRCFYHYFQTLRFSTLARHTSASGYCSEHDTTKSSMSVVENWLFIFLRSSHAFYFLIYTEIKSPFIKHYKQNIHFITKLMPRPLPQ